MNELVEGFGSVRTMSSPGAQRDRKSVLDPQRQQHLQKNIQEFAVPISELRPLLESCDVRIDTETIKSLQNLLPPAQEQVSHRRCALCCPAAFALSSDASSPISNSSLSYWWCPELSASHTKQLHVLVAVAQIGSRCGLAYLVLCGSGRPVGYI